MTRSTFVLAFLALAQMVLSQEKMQQGSQRVVTVRGEGIVFAVPDQVRLSVQINTRAESATTAMGQASSKTRDVLALLKNYGVDAKDIQTSRVSVSPILDYQRNIQPPPIVGYAGTNEFGIVFKGKLIEKVGEFLDKSITAGVSSFGNLIYESSAQRGLERDALKKAADDAQARAAVLAQQLGAAVGKVISISEGVNAPSPVAMMRSGPMDALAGAPVMTGELAINAQVTVVFELK